MRGDRSGAGPEHASRGGYRIVTADLAPLPEAIRSLVGEHVQGDLVNRVKQFYDYDFDIIFHLAASLSSKAEVATEEAHRINVEGTMQLLMLAAYRSEKYQKPVKFLFPSSIAAYGFPDTETKKAPGVSRRTSGTRLTPCTAATNFTAKNWGCITAATMASTTSTRTRR